MEIALKETYETEYWLEILYKVKSLDAAVYKELNNKCGTIRRKLIASITTAKNNQKLTVGDINPCRFAIYLTMRYTFGAICALWHEKTRIYIISHLQGKYIAIGNMSIISHFVITKYIAERKIYG